MRVPTGALSLVAVVVGVGLLGVAVEAGVEDVAEESVAFPETRFESQTEFCPPPIAGGQGSLWVATGREPARVGFEPQQTEVRSVPSETLLRQDASAEPVDVVGYEASVAAAVSLLIPTRAVGVGATACSPTASEDWYFAQGSSENDFAERLILYNPFPDEAVIRVTTFRQNGSRPVALLSDVSVPADSHTVVDFEKNLKPLPGHVGAAVSATRGRVVVWRTMAVRAEDEPRGVELSLGATTPATRLFFPDGTGTDDAVTSIVLMNPTEEEASVRLSLLTGGRPLQPPGLGGIAIPPMTAQAVALRDALQGQDPPNSFGIVIESSRSIVAERTITSEGEQPGRASEVGTAVTATDWSLLPLAEEATNDRVIVMNPGNEGVDVTVTLARVDGTALRPGVLNVSLRAQRRVVLSLDRFAHQAPFTALVTATGPVVAERAAFAGRGDLVSAIGVPLEEE